MKAVLIRAACILALATPALAASIGLTNQGFETADTTGWTNLGDVSVVPGAIVDLDNPRWSVGPFGNLMAQLDTQPDLLVDIEAFLEIADGTLQPFNQNPLTVGSAIYQDFSGDAGDTLTEFWNFVTRDYFDYNDMAFAIVVEPDSTTSVSVLASIWDGGLEIGDEGATGWQQFDFTLSQTGTHRIAFVVMNSDDDSIDSVLFLDDQAGDFENLNPPPPPVAEVPEPASLAIVGLGLTAIAASLRRRKTL